jgi:hypothetical protein
MWDIIQLHFKDPFSKIIASMLEHIDIMPTRDIALSCNTRSHLSQCTSPEVTSLNGSIGFSTLSTTCHDHIPRNNWFPPNKFESVGMHQYCTKVPCLQTSPTRPCQISRAHGLATSYSYMPTHGLFSFISPPFSYFLFSNLRLRSISYISARCFRLDCCSVP